MRLIIGLGNPGKKFEKTRHNIGARVIRELERLNLKNVVLTKPTAFFMNDSGKVVKKLIKKYKLKTKNLFVVHDDLDLPLGKLRISASRGSAGHKGVQSIIDELGTKNFVRFRIGIGPTLRNIKKSTIVGKVDTFVLKNFTKEEEKIVKKTIKKIAEAIEFAIQEGLEKAMNKYNK